MKRTVLGIIVIILIVVVSFSFVAHPSVDNSIYQTNMVESPKTRTVSIYIPGSVFHRYALIEENVNVFLEELRESEGNEDIDFETLRYSIDDDDNMTLVLSQQEYVEWVEGAISLLDIIKERCESEQMLCEFNEDYSSCTISLQGSDYELSKNSLAAYPVPLAAKIVLDYYHAFTGTLDVNSVVLVKDIETGETIDSSNNYQMSQ